MSCPSWEKGCWQWKLFISIQQIFLWRLLAWRPVLLLPGQRAEWFSMSLSSRWTTRLAEVSGEQQRWAGLRGWFVVALLSEPLTPAAVLPSDPPSQSGHHFLVFFWGCSSRKLSWNNSSWPSWSLKKQPWRELIVWKYLKKKKTESLLTRGEILE